MRNLIMLKRTTRVLSLIDLEDMGNTENIPDAALEIDSLRRSISVPNGESDANYSQLVQKNCCFSPQVTTTTITTNRVKKTPLPNVAPPVPPVPKRGPIKR